MHQEEVARTHKTELQLQHAVRLFLTYNLGRTFFLCVSEDYYKEMLQNKHCSANSSKRAHLSVLAENVSAFGQIYICDGWTGKSSNRSPFK